jgi:predicted lipoprotein with Yx(FWY)xxD motif
MADSFGLFMRIAFTSIKGTCMNFKLFLLTGAMSAAGLAQAAEPAKFENGLLVAANGMTLYTFDKDQKNKSNCDGGCLKAWPALLAGDDTKVSGEFGFILRNDGSKQVALDGKPLYFYVGDQKVGDITGDGAAGTWRAVRRGEAPKRASQSSPNSGYSY